MGQAAVGLPLDVLSCEAEACRLSACKTKCEAAGHHFHLFPDPLNFEPPRAEDSVILSPCEKACKTRLPCLVRAEGLPCCSEKGLQARSVGGARQEDGGLSPACVQQQHQQLEADLEHGHRSLDAWLQAELKSSRSMDSPSLTEVRRATAAGTDDTITEASSAQREESPAIAQHGFELKESPAIAQHGFDPKESPAIAQHGFDPKDAESVEPICDSKVSEDTDEQTPVVAAAKGEANIEVDEVEADVDKAQELAEKESIEDFAKLAKKAPEKAIVPDVSPCTAVAVAVVATGASPSAEGVVRTETYGFTLFHISDALPEGSEGSASDRASVPLQQQEAPRRGLPTPGSLIPGAAHQGSPKRRATRNDGSQLKRQQVQQAPRTGLPCPGSLMPGTAQKGTKGGGRGAAAGRTRHKASPRRKAQELMLW